MKLKYEVKEQGKTINQILEEKYKFSARLFSKLIREKRVYLNGKAIDTRNIAKQGDILTIDLDYEENNSNIVSKKMNLDIVYEDEGMLVLNKPAGIAVHPSIEHYEDSLASGIKFYFEQKEIHKKIRLVNRLDYNTSGLIVIAKNEYIQESLIRQMKNNIFLKEYIALVEGIFKNKKGTIDEPIARKKGSIIERCVSEDGQNAVTKYEVIREYDGYSMIRCKLITGRTHQIRVHMAYIGHPLLGDNLYGGNCEKMKRQALHCYKLDFVHPITNDKMEFLLEMPQDFLTENKKIL